MAVETSERRLRSQVEDDLGRELSDEEWELFKRLQGQAATGQAPLPQAAAKPRRWEWTPRDRVAFFAGLLVAAAAVGMFLEADLMFSPFVKFPLAVFVVGCAVVGLGFWFAAFPRPEEGDSAWGWLGSVLVWLWWGFFIGVFVGVPVAVAGVALLVEDRDAFTSEKREILGNGVVPAEALAWGLSFVALILLFAGLPSKRS